MKNMFLLFALIPFLLKGQPGVLDFGEGETILNSKMAFFNNNTLIAFYITVDQAASTGFLCYRLTTNYGNTWTSKTLIDTVDYPGNNYSNLTSQIDAIKMTNGKFLLVYKNTKWMRRIFDDNLNFSEKKEIPTPDSYLATRNYNELFLTQNLDGSVWLLHSRWEWRQIFYLKSFDYGETWSEQYQLKLLETGSDDPSLVSVDLNNYLLFHSKRMVSKKYQVYLSRSSDAGATWITGDSPILTLDYSLTNPTAYRTDDGMIHLFAEASFPTSFSQFKNNEIVLFRSSDNGNSWTEPVIITNYSGYDGQFSLYYHDNRWLINYYSSRFNLNYKYNHFFGILGNEFDKLPPPAVYKAERKYKYPDSDLIVQIWIGSGEAVDAVYIKYRVEGGNTDSLLLYDDGLHNDSSANDMIYANTVSGLLQNKLVDLSYLIESMGNRFEVRDTTVITPFHGTLDAYRINVNNLNIPIDKVGRIPGNESADDPNMPELHGFGGYKDIPILFSNGFMMSGLYNNSIWANGLFTVFSYEYQAGRIGTAPKANENKLYIVRSSDPPFSDTWQSWKAAVKNGAYFYDGNKDGIYNPVDLNYNGIWDPDEDRPDLIGDITAFCVYNDGVPASNRVFGGNPLGIEIRQTIYGSADTVNSVFNNSLIFRYSIVNKNIWKDRLDSVYFSVMADPDIGDHSDDFIGCDTIINSGYSYNKAPDRIFGDDCPTIMFSILQSPPVYIPGITFQDVNQNQQYDEGIDIPLDTSYNKLGKYIGQTVYPGAKNVGLSSFNFFMGLWPTHNEPYTTQHVRYFSEGKNMLGDWVDPCSFAYGSVINEDCNLVNKKYPYSGNPVIPSGWVNILTANPKIFVTTGPFNLEYNQPADIIYAYIVGQGLTSIASVDAAKSFANDLINSYNSNFANFPAIQENNTSNIVVESHKLFDNYPNPFNPVTSILYRVNERTDVRIDVFDILGRKVATLVDEQKDAGYYRIQFDGKNLASGVYIYRLITNNYSASKKMLLIK